MRIFTAKLHYIAVNELGSYRNRNIKRDPFRKGIAALLPEAYKRFWAEYTATPAPVHYKPQEGKWRLDKYGVVKPIQNIPIPLKYPNELNEGIWGGEAIIQGFRQEGNKYTRRVAAWWMPTLRESVLYSEVLKKHMKVIVTDRTLDLVHKNQGFDQYLLNTKACDLKSWLALRLKRKILLTIRENTYPHDDKEVEFVKKVFDQYLNEYDHEFIEWYGLPMEEAKAKRKKQLDAEKVDVPLKLVYRQKLLEDLKSGSDELPSPPDKKDFQSILSNPSKLLGTAKSILPNPSKLLGTAKSILPNPSKFFGKAKSIPSSSQ